MNVTVKKSNFQHSFAILNNVSGISEREIIAIEVENGYFYTSVISNTFGSFAHEGPTLFLSSAWIQLLGLDVDSSVIIMGVKKHPGIKTKSVLLQPCSKDDWEIFQYNAEIIKNNLLNQISVVQAGKILIIFCNQIQVKVKVVKIIPSQNWAMLEDSTELHVKPMERKDAIPTLPGDILDYKMKLRVCLTPWDSPNEDHRLCAFINASLLKSDPTYIEFSAKTWEDDILKRMLKCHPTDDLPENHILLPRELSSFLGLDTGSYIEIEEVYDELFEQSGQARVNMQNGFSIMEFRETFKCYPMVIPRLMELIFEGKFVICTMDDNVKIESAEAPYELFQGCQLFGGRDDYLSAIFLDGVKEVMEKLLLAPELVTHSILKGETGCGKTTALEQIKRKFGYEKYVFCRLVSCRKMIGKKVEVIQKEISSLYQDCIERQPSAILFDDLDSLCAAQNAEGGENLAEGNYLHA